MTDSTVGDPANSCDEVSVTGTVRAMLSESSDCICCEGLHRFSTGFDLDRRVSPYDSSNDIASFVFNRLHHMPDGARVRVTVEQVSPEAEPLNDPRVKADRYVIYPTGYEDFVNSDKFYWCLAVVDGHSWGWSVRQHGGGQSPFAMNRKGEWVYESRGSGHNKARRWTLAEALTLALRHVDRYTINGCTAAEASAVVAARHVG